MHTPRVARGQPITTRSTLGMLLCLSLSHSAFAQVIDVTNPPVGFTALVANNPAFDNGPPFNDLIQNGATPGSPVTFQFPPGDYYFGGTTSNPSDAHILLDQRKGTIECTTPNPAQRPRLIFANLDRHGLVIKNSTGPITVQDLEFDTLAFPSTQGTVVALYTDVSNNRMVDIAIDTASGFPEPTLGNFWQQKARHLLFFDSGMRRVKDRTDLYEILLYPLPNSTTKVADIVAASTPGTYTVRLNQTSTTGWSGQNVAVNDLVVIKTDTFKPIVRAERCQDLTFRDLTIRRSCSSAISDSYSSNTVIDNVTVEPAGIGLISSNRDGFHIQGPRTGPTITNCSLTRTGDDAIAARSDWMRILSTSTANNTVNIRARAQLRIDANDVFEFYNGNTFAIRGSATVLAAPTTWTQVTIGGVTYRETTIQFSTPLPSGIVANDWTADLNSLGNGFTIADNTIRENRARGILIKTRGGVVERNDIYATTMAGIMAGSQLEDTGTQEAGFIKDVVIQDNEIRDCQTRHTSAWHSAAITVMTQMNNIGSSPNMSNGVNNVEMVNSNIDIRRNRIDHAGRTGILMMNVDTAVIEDNIITNGYWNPQPGSPSHSGLDAVPLQMVNLQKCSNVKFNQNRVEPVPGHAGFHAAANCSAITNTNNRMLVGTNLEPEGQNGFPSTYNVFYYPFASDTEIEDNVKYGLENVALVGSYPALPWYLGDQSLWLLYPGSFLSANGVNPVELEITFGSSSLAGDLQWQVLAVDALGSITVLDTLKNISPDLDASAPVPYYTRRRIVNPVSNTAEIRIVQTSPGTPTSALFLDEVWFDIGSL